MSSERTILIVDLRVIVAVDHDEDADYIDVREAAIDGAYAYVKGGKAVDELIPDGPDDLDPDVTVTLAYVQT